MTTSPVNPRPARWGLIVLGLLLAPTAVAVTIAVLDFLFLGPSTRWPALAVLAVVAILAALSATVVTGAQFLAAGTGGGGGRLAPAYRSLRVALLLTSALTAIALAALLSKEREVPPDAVLAAILSAVSVASFLLARLAGRRAGHARDAGWREVAYAALCSVPLLLLMALLLALFTPRTHVHVDLWPYEGTNNARNLAIILSEHSYTRGWPPYGGKSFVLSLVAYGLIDLRNPENLEIFSCPEPGEEIPPPDRAAYETITQESLAVRRFPDLTDFAGRRNDEPAWRLGPEDWKGDEPILGCCVGEYVILGFSDGAAQCFDREDLGLGPDDEVVFGEASRSPLLRALSDR